MKVLIIGNGAREHALVWKIAQSPKVSKIFVAPGNAATAEIAENINIGPEDIYKLLDFAKSENIDLTLVGPELPLVLAIVDIFNEAGLSIFGPNKECARLEGSKTYAKEFMCRHNIPTAKYKEYTNAKEAYEDIGIYGFPMVIKADGLAAGKGVIIAEDKDHAEKSLKEIMEDKRFGKAGDKILIEELLIGTEASVMCFVDGNTIKAMESVKDYKKIFDNDLGENTGGMGTCSPNYVYNDSIAKKVEENILKPFMEGIKKDGLIFKGVIFIGVILTDRGPKVIEFNVRFGDPETQVILPRMESDIVEIMEACIEGKLHEVEISWSDEAAVCVVIASGGYPENYEKGQIITGLKDLEQTMVFHAGTKKVYNKLLTDGGRVLSIVAKGNSVSEAKRVVYSEIDKINFKKMQYRSDIGK